MRGRDDAEARRASQLNRRPVKARHLRRLLLARIGNLEPDLPFTLILNPDGFNFLWSGDMGNWLIAMLYEICDGVGTNTVNIDAGKHPCMTFNFRGREWPIAKRRGTIHVRSGDHYVT